MTSLQLAQRGYMAMVGRMVTILPHAPKSLGYVTLSCAEVLRYASPKASGVRRYSRLKT